MKSQLCVGLALVLSAAGAASLQAQNTPEKASKPAGASDSSVAAPAGITPELIAQGEKVFHGPGNCYACHGTNGQGAVGPNLTDAEWLHSKGTFEEIVGQITEGVPQEKSKTGIPMPAKGGGSISDDDVKAVAAYVYSLSHK